VAPGEPRGTPGPSLCRLCRRPIPHAVAKCPYCGARQLWNSGQAGRAPRAGRIAAYVAALIVLVAVALVGLSVLRAVKTPLTAVESGGRPAASSPTDCAALAAELANPTASDRLTPEVHARVRQCLERR